jgi:hypothetical protein
MMTAAMPRVEPSPRTRLLVGVLAAIATWILLAYIVCSIIYLFEGQGA